jgi:integrase
MSFGKNLQYLRQLSANMTQETLAEKGFSPLLIAERLGHEKVQTTMDIYSHLYPNKQQEVARILKETIDPKSSDSAGYKKSEKM